MPASFSKNRISIILKKISDKISYNLVLQVIKNRLTAIGFEFTASILFQDKINTIKLLDYEANMPDYKVEFLDASDMKIIGSNIRGYSHEDFLNSLKNGKKCIGVKHRGEILAFVWYDFNECNFQPAWFKLKKNEAYSYRLHTMEPYRGRNIAPYLKYQSYKILEKIGKDTFYSISEYVNSSSLKYRKKLNSKKLKLILFIRLFKKYQWTLTLKTYK